MMLSVDKVSELLGLSRALVYREIHAGHLPHYRFGKNAIRISEEDLEAYIAARRTGENQRASTVKAEPAMDRPSQFRHVNVSRLLARQS